MRETPHSVMLGGRKQHVSCVRIRVLMYAGRLAYGLVSVCSKANIKSKLLRVNRHCEMRLRSALCTFRASGCSFDDFDGRCCKVLCSDSQGDNGSRSRCASTTSLQRVLHRMQVNEARFRVVVSTRLLVNERSVGKQKFLTSDSTFPIMKQSCSFCIITTYYYCSDKASGQEEKVRHKDCPVRQHADSSSGRHGTALQLCRCGLDASRSSCPSNIK